MEFQDIVGYQQNGSKRFTVSEKIRDCGQRLQSK